MTKFCFCIKLFRRLQYTLSKTFCLKLPDVLVNLTKISTGQSRNLTGNLHHPALILTPGTLNDHNIKCNGHEKLYSPL